MWALDNCGVIYTAGLLDYCCYLLTYENSRWVLGCCVSSWWELCSMP